MLDPSLREILDQCKGRMNAAALILNDTHVWLEDAALREHSQPKDELAAVIAQTLFVANEITALRLAFERMQLREEVAGRLRLVKGSKEDQK